MAVWLFEPDFGRSQLVAAVEEELDFYGTTFGEPTGQPLPTAYLALPGVAALHWVARAQLAVYWPEEFAGLSARHRRRPYREEMLQTGERVVVMETGWVWVGQARL